MEVFRFLLRMYPDAASIPDSLGRTPYSKYVGRKNDHARLLLRADPTVNCVELHRLNYLARRMALFLFFVGVRADGELTLFSQLVLCEQWCPSYEAESESVSMNHLGDFVYARVL